MYDTFISYRRSDGGRVARRLRSQLLDYALPTIIKDSDKKLSVYLDQAYEVATEDFFEHTVKPALEQSTSLIVVQTPDAALTRGDGSNNWISREVDYYLSLPGNRPVWVALGKGSFDDPLPGDLDKKFPNVERVDVRSLDGWAGRLSEHELVKFIAPLYEVPDSKLPDLRREEERKSASRRRWFGIGALATVVLLSALVASAWVGWNNLQHQAALRLSVASESLPSGELDTALLLAALALETWDTPTARRVLIEHLNRNPLLNLYVHCPEGEFANGIAHAIGADRVALGCESGVQLIDLQDTKTTTLLYEANNSHITAISGGRFVVGSGHNENRQLTYLPVMGDAVKYATPHRRSFKSVDMFPDGLHLRVLDWEGESSFWKIVPDGLETIAPPLDAHGLSEPLGFDEQVALANQHNRCGHEPIFRTDPHTIKAGDLLAYSTENNKVSLQRGRADCALLEGFVHNVHELTVWPTDNPQRLIAAGQNGLDRYGGIIWDLEQVHPLATQLVPPPPGHVGRGDVAISHDATTVAAVYRGLLTVVDVASSTVRTRNVPADAARLDMSSDGVRLAFKTTDEAFVVDLSDGGPLSLSSLIAGDEKLGAPLKVMFSDVDELYVLYRNGFVNVDTGDTVLDISTSYCSGLSADGGHWYSADNDIEVREVQTDALGEGRPMSSSLDGSITCAASILQGDLLVRLYERSGSHQIELLQPSIFGLETSVILQNPFRRESGLLVNLDEPILSTDGHRLIVLSQDEEDRLMLYNIEQRSFEGALMAGKFEAVDMDGLGRLAVSYGSAGVLLWDLDPQNWIATSRRIAARRFSASEEMTFLD